MREGGLAQFGEQLCVRGKDVARVRAEAGADFVLQGFKTGGDGGDGLIEGGAVGVQGVAVVLWRVAAPDGGADGRGSRRGSAGEQATVAAVCRVAEVGGGEVAEGLQGGGGIVAVGVQGEAVAATRLQQGELVQAFAVRLFVAAGEDEAGVVGRKRGGKARGGAGVQAVAVGQRYGGAGAAWYGNGRSAGRHVFAQRHLFGGECLRGFAGDGF